MSEEHTVAIVSFEGALKREIKRVRQKLQQVESLTSFTFRIDADGRVHDGTVDLEFSIGLGSYGDEVKGSSLSAVLDEALRRKGWKDINAPKALSYEKIPSDDTDPIPF